MTDTPSPENYIRPETPGQFKISERVRAKMNAEADDYKPRTLLGRGINGVWDMAAGEAATNLEKSNRASRSDQIAEITADTVSAVPRLGYITGGLARGVLLADVSGSKDASGRQFLLNSAQGMALHGIGRLGSANFKAASSELSAGLRPTLGAELRGHMLSGAGFGAVKTAFNEQSWRDNQGKFSVSTGIENVTLSSALGGTIGMPSGLVGARFARASSVLIGTEAERTVVGALTKNTIGGASAGLSGGAVFGGVEASHRSFTAASILGGMKDGAVTGLFTGGLLGASEHVSLRGAGRSRPGSTQTETGQTAREAIVTRTGGELQIKPVPQVGSKVAEHVRASSETVARSNRLAESLLGREMLQSEFPTKAGKDNSPADMPDISDRGTRTLTPEQRMRYLWSDAGKLAAYESFKYDAFAETRVTDYKGRLGTPVSEERTVQVASKDLPAGYADMLKFFDVKPGKPKPTFEEFAKHLENEQQAVRVYQVEGHSTKIVVPEEYARQLDEVRQLRLRLETPTVYDNLPMDVKVKLSNAAKDGDARIFGKYMPASEVSKVINVLDAGLKLSKHPLALRALPEDLIPILDALPVPGLVKEVRLDNTANIQDRYSRMQYGDPKFSAAATASRSGEVVLYGADRNSALTEYVMHEWAHLSKWNMPEHSRLFDLAAAVDKVDLNIDHKATREAQAGSSKVQDYVRKDDVYHPSEHASRDLDEGWAVGKAQELMKADPDTLFIYMKEAPVRTMVLSAALEHAITQAGVGKVKQTGGTHADVFLERVRYIDDAVRPLAQQQLVESIKSGTPQQKANAAELLGLFGDKSHIDVLRRMALNKRNDVLPDTMVDPQNGPKTLQRIAFDSMVKLSGKSDAERFEFAFEEGLREPSLRRMARDTIVKIPDFREGFYRRILDWSGDRGALPEMLRMMRSPMGDRHGREVLYHEMMKNLQGDKQQQVDWSLSVVETVPSMREYVINTLSSRVDQGFSNRSLRDIEVVLESKRGTFSDQAKLAADNLLTKIANTRKVEDATRLTGGGEMARLKLLEDLVTAKDQRAIAPLLALSVSGKPQVEAAAIENLRNFSPSLVRFYGRQVRASMGADRQRIMKLERVLEGRAGPGPGTIASGG